MKKDSHFHTNLTKFGIGLGCFFPIIAFIIDIAKENLPWTIASLEVILIQNPLHWIISTAPVVLGLVFYFLGYKIIDREKELKMVAEKEKNQLILIENFIGQLERGEYTKDFDKDLENERIATLLNKFRSKLLSDREMEITRRWVNEGLAQFGEILRSQNNVDVLSLAILKFLIQYVDFIQGGVFIAYGEQDNIKLELKACYAYDRRKHLTKTIEPGEGMVGQCYLEKQTILLYDVPPEYLTITSGLGQTNPTCIIILPLKANDEVEGIIEFAGFNKLKKHEVEFLEKVTENIGAVLKTVKNNERTKILLESTRQQAEEMQAQEEEMRQNMEELSATQEEMMRKEKEFIREIQQYKKQLGLI